MILLSRGIDMPKYNDINDIYKNNNHLKKYIEEYLNSEYNTSKNTRNSYFYDLIELAKYYNKDIAFLNKEDIQ